LTVTTYAPAVVDATYGDADHPRPAIGGFDAASGSVV